MNGTQPLTPTMLKGLAHPLRMGMLGSLRADGPATSSQLAERFETNTGATSYHLRQLAKHGFVEDVDSVGDARERYWKATHRYSDVDPTAIREDPEGAGLFDEFARFVSSAREAEVDLWLETQTEWVPEWASASALDDYFAKLTLAEFKVLIDKIRLLITETAENAVESPDSVPVRLHLLGFPIKDQVELWKQAAKGRSARVDDDQ